MQSNDVPHIALVGFMGAGKTTVGKLLAERLQLPFADTDVHLVSRIGRSIPEFFASEGEAAFRDHEADVLKTVCAFPPHVIATGGGIVLRPENRDALQSSAFVVWLTARPDIVALRVGGGQDRPVLGGEVEPLPVRILRLLGERGPLYQQTAHAIVDTSDRRPASVVWEIVRKWERWRHSEEVRPPSPGPFPRRREEGEEEKLPDSSSAKTNNIVPPSSRLRGKGPGDGGLTSTEPGEDVDPHFQQTAGDKPPPYRDGDRSLPTLSHHRPAAITGEIISQLPGEGRYRQVTPELRQVARDLRRAMTPAEARLWSALRNRQISGLRFRRQHAIGTFIVDFYCAECKLVLEVDGGIHQRRDIAEHDALREEAIKLRGMHVLCFTNDAVLNDVAGVTEQIRSYALTCTVE